MEWNSRETGKCAKCHGSGIASTADRARGRIAFVCGCEAGTRHAEWIGVELSTLQGTPVRRDYGLPYAEAAADCHWCDGVGTYTSTGGQTWHCRNCKAGLAKVDQDEGSAFVAVVKAPPDDDELKPANYVEAFDDWNEREVDR